MKLWRWILLLVIVAALAAFGWHWVAEDPGYVLVQLRGWQAETTVVAAIVILLLAWAVLSAVWFAVRWPFGAFTRRHRRLSRKKMSEGLLALMEGRHGDAERDRDVQDQRSFTDQRGVVHARPRLAGIRRKNRRQCSMRRPTGDPPAAAGCHGFARILPQAGGSQRSG